MLVKRVLILQLINGRWIEKTILEEEKKKQQPNCQWKLRRKTFINIFNENNNIKNFKKNSLVILWNTQKEFPLIILKGIKTQQLYPLSSSSSLMKITGALFLSFHQFQKPPL